MTSRRRGTTMAELLVYLGLLSAGLLVAGGLELGARRSLALQQGLIDIELQSATLLGHLRRDVEAARRLELDRGALLVERQDGRRVRYEAGLRSEAGGDLAAERREAFALNTKLAVSLEGAPNAAPVVVVVATFTSRGRDGVLERVHRRTASPRAELRP